MFLPNKLAPDLSRINPLKGSAICVAEQFRATRFRALQDQRRHGRRCLVRHGPRDAVILTAGHTRDP